MTHKKISHAAYIKELLKEGIPRIGLHLMLLTSALENVTDRMDSQDGERIFFINKKELLESGVAYVGYHCRTFVRDVLESFDDSFSVAQAMAINNASVPAVLGYSISREPDATSFACAVYPDGKLGYDVVEMHSNGEVIVKPVNEEYFMTVPQE